MTGHLLKYALLAAAVIGVVGWLFPAWRVRIRQAVNRLALGLLAGSVVYVLWIVLGG